MEKVWEGDGAKKKNGYKQIKGDEARNKKKQMKKKKKDKQKDRKKERKKE